MARSFTLIQLITKGRQRCDQENRDVLGASEWKECFSTAWGEFYGLLVESGMRYFESEDTVSTLADTSTYALPSNFLASIGVDRLVNGSSGERRELNQLMAQERNIFSSSSGSEGSTAYAMVGTNLKLYPTPPAGQTYYHVYVPQPTDYSASADSTSIDVVTPDGEAFLTYSLAVCGAAKEESTMLGFFQDEREAARQRVQTWAHNRALNQPRRRIVDDGWSYYDEGDYQY